MEARLKNLRKTIGANSQTQNKHSMVMVSSKTIEIFNCLLKTIIFVNGLTLPL